MRTDIPTRVLIVDDNQQYRDALKRALLLEEFDVCEAAHADAALEILQTHPPDVVVTDLQMRTEREGLDLIETVRATDPLLPVIMISAVGSFEEGALATKLGAVHVIHKSRIEEELEGFLETVRTANDASCRSREQLGVVARAQASGELKEGDEHVSAVKALLADPDVDPYVKGEAYDVIISIGQGDMLRESESSMREAAASGQYEELNAAALARLRAVLSGYDALQEDSRKALVTAEYLYGLEDEPTAPDFARTVAFSYCFAVENEVRARLKGRITRLGSDRLNQRIFEACVDKKARRVDMGLHQELMQAVRSRGIKFTIDNVRNVIFGLIHRKERYKPDGLKDVGILLLCFARDYSFSKRGQQIEVRNPMRVKGLPYDDDIINLAGLLISLQFARNPYIHPDVQKRERITTIRQTTFDCLNALSRVR